MFAKRLVLFGRGWNCDGSSFPVLGKRILDRSIPTEDLAILLLLAYYVCAQSTAFLVSGLDKTSEPLLVLCLAKKVCCGLYGRVAFVLTAIKLPFSTLAVNLCAYNGNNVRGVNIEGQYLLNLKSNMADAFYHLDSWNANDFIPCQWKGVSCTSDGIVVGLHLNSMNLSGIISPRIGGLIHLTVLDLSFNEFSGAIPREISNCSKLEVLYLNNNKFEGEIPHELGSLSSLLKCNLCNNKLCGQLPESIGGLSSLLELVAYSNNITGPLPRSIGKLKNLSVLRMGQNLITGSIPVEVSECRNMKRFGLAQNQLEGEIPKEIGKLPSLTELVLWDNQLSGCIPKEIGNCTQLVTLALYQNNLVGGIPEDIGRLNNLEKLYLYRNSLNGTIPKTIGNLTRATEIDLSENILTAKIPSELCNIKGLYLLHLFQNDLRGFIPPELSGLRNLSKLDLSINSLDGPIPLGFQDMPNLTQLQLFNNMLSGTIPQKLGVYSSLWVVDFSENNLSGQIPRYLCRHSNLILLNLWSNNLTGNIPSEVINCRSLVQLRLGKNSLTGSFPSDLCKLVNLTAIELDENRFSGPIPPEIGQCKALQRLNLPNNFFTHELPGELCNLSLLVILNISSNKIGGSLPQEIFKGRMLQRLDLSQNQFIGTLPDEINLVQLERFVISDNKLSGIIPPIIGKLSHLMELQMGGNEFFGSIPKELGGLSSLQIAMNLSYNDLSGNIPEELGNLALLEFLLLNNNHLTGEIPSSFANLCSLLGLNLSYNDLTGPIPSIPLFRNMTLCSFIGNKDLCGKPLVGCGLPPSLSTSSPRTNTSLGRTVTIIFTAVGGISLVLVTIMVCILRRPIETISHFQDKQLRNTTSGTYMFPKEKVTFQDIVSATNDFDESFVIGRGACGTVYRALLKSGQTIAVKKLASNREGKYTENSFHAEILTLGKIRHRNIVKLYGFSYHQCSNLLLYEYMARGSLGELLHGEFSSTLDWETRYMIALGAAEGLSYLHHGCKPCIIHRDIKSNNILLNENFEAHVGDFGLAKVIDMPQSKSMSAVAGSYGYIAPEYAYTMKITEKCDIYSYGVVLLELLTGRTPVQPLDQGGDLVTWVRTYIKNNSLSSGILDSKLNLEDGIAVDHMIMVLKIALLCTNSSPLDRPAMQEVVLMLVESKQKAASLVSSQVPDFSSKEDDR
ncbi:hypothetical protein ZIOFF_041681 [Zingiber officinale]|uniref:non-specific serine/threonine protein kinase n=2 Tax=Zingiber officinale TaxID=94328 RepID=A0A8J5GJ14_ZINOF|nr:hypothetical protein ZIOFF_041681 [Zingiber officinale]